MPIQFVHYYGDRTFRLIDGLVIPDDDAEIIAVPAAMPVAEPFDKMVAILVLELVQITWEVMSAMEPSENIPTAIKGCDAPAFKLRGETAGSITMVANTFTINVTGWLFNPVKVAVIFKEDKEGKINVSFRSKGAVDVNKVASAFGGGGHVKASGCVIEGRLADVQKQVLARVESELSET